MSAKRNAAGGWFERQYQESLKRLDVAAARKQNNARVDRKRVEDDAIIDPEESGEVPYASAVNTLQVEGLDFSFHEGDHKA